jgi:hypothetical protein
MTKLIELLKALPAPFSTIGDLLRQLIRSPTGWLTSEVFRISSTRRRT